MSYCDTNITLAVLIIYLFCRKYNFKIKEKMKRLLCLFSALLLVLSSCSNDDSSRNENQVLLKKIISTDENGLKSTTIYNYNGNKIVSYIFDSQESMYFTYTGDLITKLEFKLSDGTIEQINSFEYDSNGKLVTFKRIEPMDDLGNKEVYNYNADGSISVVQYIGDSKTQTQENATGTITFLNGEVNEIISDNFSNSKYTYDTKHNPMKNVLGMDKISFTDGEASGILHNIISKIEGSNTFTSKITYNADGYPEKSFDNFEDNGTTTEYFY